MNIVNNNIDKQTDAAKTSPIKNNTSMKPLLRNEPKASSISQATPKTRIERG